MFNEEYAFNFSSQEFKACLQRSVIQLINQLNS